MEGPVAEALPALVGARVRAVAEALAPQVPTLCAALHAETVASIEQLRGDVVIQDLLLASLTSNFETFFHVGQYGLDVDEVRPPSAAVEYARRLAQRGVSANALLGAYRLGQRRGLDWLVTEVERTEDDRAVALAATRALQTLSFRFVDRVAEQVVAEHESERERWLAQRSSVRTAVLADLLAGRHVEVGAAEAALGYRLRRTHLGLVAWVAGQGAGAGDLRALEDLVGRVAAAVGATGSPLLVPQDGGLTWAWLPVARDAPAPAVADLDVIVAAAGPAVRLALGAPGTGTTGFVATHREAQRAATVASLAGAGQGPVTGFAEPGVQLASVLAADLDEVRRLVAAALGGLAGPGEAQDRLRSTLLAFLRSGSSYVATAAEVHLHKNTVKYRVDKAVELRGRPLGDDRFALELALTAWERLGAAVLPGVP